MELSHEYGRETRFQIDTENLLKEIQTNSVNVLFLTKMIKLNHTFLELNAAVPLFSGISLVQQLSSTLFCWTS